MATVPGPAVATSATGEQLAMGPVGPVGPIGPQGPAGPAGGFAGQYALQVSNGLNSNVATNGQPTLRLAGPTAAFSVGGFAPLAGSWSGGQPLIIVNTTAQPMTFVNEDASSVPANRITTLTGGPVVLPARGSAATLYYDGTTSRWLLQNIGTAFPRATDPRDYGVDLTGAASAVTAIQAAHTVALALGGDIVHYAAGTYKIDQSMTFPSGVTHKFAPGAVLSIGAGKVATFNGRIEADPTAPPIFAGSGTVAFGQGSQPYVWPDWWATAVGVTSCPIQSACNAAHAAQIPVKLRPTSYALCTGPVGLAISSAYGSVFCDVSPVAYPFAVSACTGNGVSPIVLTITANGAGGIVQNFQVGQQVNVTGVGGNTAANGLQTISAVVGDNISLQGTTGNGAYTSGGLVEVLTGAVLLYTGSGTGVQHGTSVGTTATFTPGMHMKNVRIQCVDATTTGWRIWCPVQGRFEKVTVFGPSGNTSICCHVQGPVATKLDQCDFQGQGTITTQTNYAIALQIDQAAGSTGTTTHLDLCYLHYASTALVINGCFAHAQGTVFEASQRGFSVSNLGHLEATDECWFEGIGGAGGAGTELLGYVDGTSYLSLVDSVCNVAGNCRNLFTVQAGCKIRVTGGRVLGGVGNYVLFRAAEALDTSDVEITGWSLEGTTGGVYNSTDVRSINGEVPTWKTVRWNNMAVVRYGFVQKSIPGTQVATSMSPENGNHNEVYRLVPSASYDQFGGGRLLGMSWNYDQNLSSGSYRVQVYLDGVVNLDTGNMASGKGTLDRSVLSAPIESLQGLVCQLTTTGAVNSGGDFSVDVYVGYGHMCGV